MTAKKIIDFLIARDRAAARGDVGIIRATTADLRQWGVPDDATAVNPSGSHGNRSRARRTRQEPVSEPVSVPVSPPKLPGRPKLQRCEHENVAERCEVCNPELAVK